MALETLKARVLSGLFWKFSERIGVYGIHLAIQILLARLLFPKDYALVALITVVLTVADVLVHSGFGVALVQKKDVDDVDLSSAFYLSLGSSVVLYGALFAVAPWFAEYYQEPALVAILRVQALTLPVGAFRSIQTAVLTRNMLFRKSFFTGLGGVLTTGGVGVTMAWLGYGVWALVFSQLAGAVMAATILWFLVAWRPRAVFSMGKVRTLFGFGWKILCASLMETVYNSLRTLVIGKMFDKDVLGYYNRGESLPLFAATSLDGTISSVMFPAFSSCQEDRALLRGVLRRTLITSCFVMFPLLIGLAAVSEPVVTILLTEKWLGCVAFMQICCLGYALLPLHTTNLQAINALGRSDVYLRQEILKKLVGVALILASLPFGVYALVASGVVFSVICTVINGWPNRKLLGYSPLEQWKDVMPSLALALAMGGVVWNVTLLGWEAWPTLAVQLLLGGILYLGGAWLLRFECLAHLLKTVRDQLSRPGEG